MLIAISLLEANFIVRFIERLIKTNQELLVVTQ